MLDFIVTVKCGLNLVLRCQSTLQSVNLGIYFNNKKQNPACRLIKKTKGYFKTEINVGIINIKALSKTLIPPCCHVTCHVVTDIDKERLR